MSYNDIRLAIFLVIRYIKRASIWTTVLMFFVMFLTFANLVIISGLLEGIVVGSLQNFKDRFAGDVYINNTFSSRDRIQRSQEIIKDLNNNPAVESISPRYITGIEVVETAEYRRIEEYNRPRNVLGVTARGINPEKERIVTNLDDFVIEGSYLDPRDSNSVLIGKNLIKRFSPFGDNVLQDVGVGDIIYVSFASAASGTSTDNAFAIPGAASGDDGDFLPYKVRGILNTKTDSDLAIFFLDDHVRSFQNRFDFSVDEIAVRLKDTNDAPAIVQSLKDKGYERYADIQTADDAIGRFLDDIRTTFVLLGAFIGAITLIVSAITVFIIIFVTAFARRKYIGILKGIGITSSAIRLSYTFFSLFYAITGIIGGLLFLFLIALPYFNANPIDFPFSDGILFVTNSGLIIRIVIISFITLIAGYIPAYIVSRQNTIEAIRNE